MKTLGSYSSSKSKSTLSHVGDEGSLQKAYGELEKWQNQYQKLMQQKNGFLNTSHWQSISKISSTIECNENGDSMIDLMPSYCDSMAELSEDNNYSNARLSEDSYSGNSFSSEFQLHEDLCNTELSRDLYGTDTATLQAHANREKIKHGKKLPAINPYLNFLKRLEEPENYKIKSKQFQQEVSELSSRVCNVPTLSKERKKISFDDVLTIVADEETTRKFMSNKRKLHLNLSSIPCNGGQLNLPELGHKTLHPQLITSNQLAAHFFNVKPQSKYRVTWYTDCKEWFKPRLKDSFSE